MRELDLLAWVEQLPTEPIQREYEQVRYHVSPVKLQRTVSTSPCLLTVAPEGGDGFAQPTTIKHTHTQQLISSSNSHRICRKSSQYKVLPLSEQFCRDQARCSVLFCEVKYEVFHFIFAILCFCCRVYCLCVFIMWAIEKAGLYLSNFNRRVSVMSTDAHCKVPKLENTFVQILYYWGGAEIARPDNPAPCPLRWFRLPSVLRLDVEENDWTVRERVPTSTTAGAAIRTDVCDGVLWGGVSGGIFPR